jgi:mannose-6-phosphate isomerase-like protein (cupin superfamily)
MNQDVTWHDGSVGQRLGIRVSSLQTNGSYAVVEAIAAPGAAAPLHILQNEDEHVVVLEGRFLIAHGEKKFVAEAGATFTAPKGLPHAWRNISDRPGRLLGIFTPGGLERLFEEIPNTPADKIPELAARYGLIIVGPPLEA